MPRCYLFCAILKGNTSIIKHLLYTLNLGVVVFFCFEQDILYKSVFIDLI